MTRGNVGDFRSGARETVARTTRSRRPSIPVSGGRTFFAPKSEGGEISGTVSASHPGEHRGAMAPVRRYLALLPGRTALQKLI